jgi:flagellar assembly factor FliW
MIATPINLGHSDAAEQEAAYETHLTSRFGEIQVLVDSIIDFPDGLIGLGGSRYALLRTDAKSPFVWLQSLTDPGIALPVTNPHRFFGDFAVQLADEEAERLGLANAEPADVFVTVTAASALAGFTANTKAPILVREGHGHQVLNQAPGGAVKTPLFPGLADNTAQAG